MGETEHEWTDEEVEIAIGNLLRAGVALSAALVCIGGVLYLIRYGHTRPDYHLFRGEPRNLRSVRGVVEGAATHSSRGLIQLGLLALIATPVARVLFSVYAFAREHDWLYVGVTLVVLAVLTYSLVWGRS